MMDTRQDILNYLHEKGAADVNELAGALGLSPVTFTITSMSCSATDCWKARPCGRAWGSRAISSRCVIRPIEVSTGYHRLSDRLLEILKSRMTEADVQALFERIGADIATEHAMNLQGRPLEQKIDTLIELLGEEGFMSRLEKVGADDFVLTQVNCPYQYVATRHPEVCELDLQLMSTALGTAVHREACVANGDAACTFHIKSQPIQLQA
jgi:predicted ArsR family transcriptional regulator